MIAHALKQEKVNGDAGQFAHRLMYVDCHSHLPCKRGSTVQGSRVAS